jgi:hypothetical protein
MQTLKKPEDEFEIHGYFEELGVCSGDSFRLLGTRSIEKPVDRPLGVAGRREYILTETVVLNKGHKQATIKASPAKPIRCFGHAHALCGRARAHVA